MSKVMLLHRGWLRAWRMPCAHVVSRVDVSVEGLEAHHQGMALWAGVVASARMVVAAAWALAPLVHAMLQAEAKSGQTRSSVELPPLKVVAAKPMEVAATGQARGRTPSDGQQPSLTALGLGPAVASTPRRAREVAAVVVAAVAAGGLGLSGPSATAWLGERRGRRPPRRNHHSKRRDAAATGRRQGPSSRGRVSALAMDVDPAMHCDTPHPTFSAPSSLRSMRTKAAGCWARGDLNGVC